ncbi:MAG: hypothetical protein Tsb0021_04810 [Chlamydiales bacterium]
MTISKECHLGTIPFQTFTEICTHLTLSAYPNFPSVKEIFSIRETNKDFCKKADEFLKKLNPFFWLSKKIERLEIDIISGNRLSRFFEISIKISKIEQEALGQPSPHENVYQPKNVPLDSIHSTLLVHEKAYLTYEREHQIKMIAWDYKTSVPKGLKKNYIPSGRYLFSTRQGVLNPKELNIVMSSYQKDNVHDSAAFKAQSGLKSLFIIGEEWIGQHFIGQTQDGFTLSTINLKSNSLTEIFSIPLDRQDAVLAIAQDQASSKTFYLLISNLGSSTRILRFENTGKISQVFELDVQIDKGSEITFQAFNKTLVIDVKDGEKHILSLEKCKEERLESLVPNITAIELSDGVLSYATDQTWHIDFLKNPGMESKDIPLEQGQTILKVAYATPHIFLAFTANIKAESHGKLILKNIETNCSKVYENVCYYNPISKKHLIPAYEEGKIVFLQDGKIKVRELFKIDLK